MNKHGNEKEENGLGGRNVDGTKKPCLRSGFGLLQDSYDNTLESQNGISQQQVQLQEMRATTTDGGGEEDSAELEKRDARMLLNNGQRNQLWDEMNDMDDAMTESNDSITTSLDYDQSRTTEMKNEIYSRLTFNQPSFDLVVVQKYQWWNKGKESKLGPLIHFQNTHLAYTYIALHLLHDSFFTSMLKEQYHIPGNQLLAIQLPLIDPQFLKSVILKRDELMESVLEGTIWKVSPVENCFSVIDIVSLIANST